MPEPESRESFIVRFRSLRHRNFQLYWTGQLVSLVGTWMQSVAQGWLMHRLTSSPFMLGLLGFAQFMPIMLFSLWAGAVVDRVDKRRLLFVTQGLFTVQAALLATAVTTGVVRPWMVLALATVFGTINAFDLPARQSFIVDMVGKEDMSNAIALNSAAFNTARIVGPAVAGVLLTTIGEGGCFWLNALSFIAVLWSLAQMHIAPRERDRGPLGSTLMEGVRYAWNTRSHRNLLVLLGLTAGLGFQYMILLPVYARDILKAGPGAFGMLVSAFGLGALLSAVRLTQRLDRWALRRNLLIGLLTSGLGLGIFAWSRNLWLSCAAGLLAGFGLIVYVASTNTMLQQTTEDRFRGRIMSLYTLMFAGTAPIGALIAGVIAQRFGAPYATSFSALVLLLGALWVSYRLRAIAAQQAMAAAAPPAVEKVG